MIPDVAFDLDLSHGRCVGVRLPATVADVEGLAEDILLLEERTFAAGLPPRRRLTWVGGRVALRLALRAARLEVPAVLSDARGALLLPRGISGSVSHKETVAAGLVAREGDPGRVGVDVEIDKPTTTDVSARVLADDEVAELAGLSPEARAAEVLVRFSAKEAIYKALDPYVQRYVGFKEVSVSTEPGGGARVTTRLREGEGPFLVEVTWRRADGLVLTTARVTPRQE